ncbi:MAG: hypothetical protein M0Q92_00820 [Methanoregula sp.]|jgi:hypothetical protein|nr:hypothetical protein [Methanoregula sp.]
MQVVNLHGHSRYDRKRGDDESTSGFDGGSGSGHAGFKFIIFFCADRIWKKHNERCTDSNRIPVSIDKNVCGMVIAMNISGRMQFFSSSHPVLIFAYHVHFGLSDSSL